MTITQGTVYTHCDAMCALPVCSVIRVALGQLTAMLLKNIVSIGFKQGISVDPLMWPIPSGESCWWRVHFIFHYGFCDFLEIWREGRKRGNPVEVDSRSFLHFFLSLTHRLSSHASSN